jgi:hypothetical protein
MRNMKRIVHKSRSFKEAEEWDIRQQQALTPQERQHIARELKERVYGAHCPDIREAENKQ